MRKLFLFLVFVLMLLPVFSQIRGKVFDSETGDPLSGAHIIADEEKTITDFTGNFSLVKPTTAIIVSHLGYFPDTLNISAKTSEITVALNPEVKSIEPVIIRGNLNEFPIRQMPSSVGHISNLQKQNINPVSYTENLNSIPGIYAHTGTLNTNRITIRGIGSRTPYATNRIKAYFEGIPLTTGDGSTEIEDIDPSLIQSIEVLKGSKSALYGSGLGGAIVLNKPTISNGLHVKAGLTVASYNTLQSDVGIQYKNKGFYVSGNYAISSTNGWRENSKYQRKNLMLNTGFTNAKNQIDFLFLAIDVNAQIPSSLNEEDFLNNPEVAAPNWLVVAGFEDYRKYLTGIRFKHIFSDKVVNSTNIFFQAYDGYESRPFNILDDESNSWGIRNITRILISNLKLQAGFEGLFENYQWAIFETLSGEQGNLENKFAESRTPISVFLNGQYQISDHTIIEAGLSLNSLNYSLKDKLQNPEDLSGDYKYDVVYSPFIGFNTKLNTGFNLYGSLSHGFSAPSVEETLLPEGSINPDLKPETGINAEAGIRYESQNKRFFLDAGIYRLWAQNLLITKRETEDIFYGANAGKTQHSGIEITSKYMLTEAQSKFPVSVDFNYNFTKATFADFEDDGVDYSGNTLPGIPQQTIWASATIDSKFGFYLIPQYQFTGKQYMNDSNDKHYGAFSLFNIKAGYAIKLAKVKADLSFGIRNVFDAHYSSMILVNAPSFGGNQPRYYYPGMPRNYFLGLRISF